MHSCDLLKICQSTIWRLQFLFITQHEAPFINKSEATKRSRDRKENGKWTNVTNRRSRVGCQPHFTRIFQQENKANFQVPIDFCNSSRFCCKLFLFLRRPWHIYYQCTLMYRARHETSNLRARYLLHQRLSSSCFGPKIARNPFQSL